MRWVAYFLLVLSVVYLADAFRDQARGIASASAPTRSARVETVRRIDNPDHFEKAMMYQWARAGVCLAGGLIVLGMYRRADRLDPFGRDMDTSRSMQDLERTLDAKMKWYRRPEHLPPDFDEPRHPRE